MARPVPFCHAKVVLRARFPANRGVLHVRYLRSSSVASSVVLFLRRRVGGRLRAQSAHREHSVEGFIAASKTFDSGEKMQAAAWTVQCA